MTEVTQVVQVLVGGIACSCSSTIDCIAESKSADDDRLDRGSFQMDVARVCWLQLSQQLFLFSVFGLGLCLEPGIRELLESCC